MINLFTARDTNAGQRVITCVYSGEQYIYTEPFAWGYMSREHSYCHNWMPISYAEVKNFMATKTFVPVDHHKAD